MCSNDHELIQAVREENILEAKSILKYYTSIYNAEDIIVEAINPLIDDDKAQIKKWNLTIEKLCKEFKVHMIVSPAPRYLDQDQEEIFKIVLAIRDNAKVWDINLKRSFHLPTVDELKLEFDYLEDKVWDTKAIEDTINLEIRTDYDKHANEAFFPYFPLNDGEDYNGRLIYEVYIGLLTRFILPDGLSFSEPEAIRDYWYVQYPYSKTVELKGFSI